MASTSMAPLTIGLMATLVDQRYKDQLQACRETWIPKGRDLGVNTYFFVGEVTDSTLEEGKTDIVRLEGVKDDYHSATHKQWFGLRYLYRYHPSKFYLLAGTDNYIHIDRILEVTEKYDEDEPLYIGGYSEARPVDRFILTFPFGGGGLILSHAALSLIEPMIDQAMTVWETLYGHDSASRDACDVSLGYLIRRLGITTLTIQGLYPCSWVQYFKDSIFPFNTGDFIAEKIRVCHFMEAADQHLYHTYGVKGIPAYTMIVAINLALPPKIKKRMTRVPPGLKNVLIYASGAESWAIIKTLVDDYGSGPKTVVMAKASQELVKVNGSLGLTVRLMEHQNDLQGIEAFIVGRDELPDDETLNKIKELVKDKVIIDL